MRDETIKLKEKEMKDGREITREKMEEITQKVKTGWLVKKAV